MVKESFEKITKKELEEIIKGKKIRNKKLVLTNTFIRDSEELRAWRNLLELLVCMQRSSNIRIQPAFIIERGWKK